MKLLLRLFENDSDTGLQRSLDQGRLTIGRGAENDWVLDDPDRTISKGHCRIDSSDGGFLLTDTSTNGVFLAGHPQALGRGHSCALEDGDSFSLGPYRVAVQLVGQRGSYSDNAGDGTDGARSPIAGERDDAWLSDIPLGGFGPDRRAMPEGWQAPPDPGAYAASGDYEAQSARALPQGGVLRGPPERAPEEAFAHSSEHIAAPANVMRLPQAQVTLPADWNEAGSAPAGQPAVASTPPPAWPPVLPEEAPAETPILPPDWLLEEDTPAALPQTPPMPDSWSEPAPSASTAPAGATLFAAPDPAPPIGASPAVSAPAAFAPAAPAPAVGSAPAVATSPAPSPKPAATPRAVPAAALRVAEAPAPAGSPPSRQATAASSRPAPSRPRPPAPGPAPAPAPVAEAVSSPPAGPAAVETLVPPDPDALVAAFLDGAGLPAGTLAGADQAAAFRALGAMVRAAVEGVRDVLSTRALVKSEFRVEQTVLKRTDNNAMKFAPDAQRCLAALVGTAPQGFLPGAAAMQQSMDDIKLHELALVAALNSVFADLSTQLDPEAIAGKMRAGGNLSSLLPYAREAACWAIYCETYARLRDSGASNTAGSLLAPLADAYARQLRRVQ